MAQLIKCVVCLMLFIIIFSIWGYSFSHILKLNAKHLPMQMLVGFFACFIVFEIVILPVVFWHNSLKMAVGLVLVVTIVLTALMLWKDKLNFLNNIKIIAVTPWLALAVCTVGVMTIVAALQQYMGYDTTYYVGEVNAFLYYGEFWTRDAFVGMAETSVIPLHYALSCFYPICAVFSFLFQVDARIMMMFTVRALCVLLFACVSYSWGFVLFCKRGKTDTSSIKEKETEMICQRNGSLFTTLSAVLCIFLMDNHSSSFMMMVRGYESKGYCAAVVAPMCTYALVMLCRDLESVSNWRLLGLIAWASMPIAMSSMAVIPVAIGVVGLALMICHKKFWYIFKRCLYCVLPNMILMAWYILGTYLPRMKG